METLLMYMGNLFQHFLGILWSRKQPASVLDLLILFVAE